MKRNFFSFSNLKGDYPAIEESIRRGAPTAVFGVADTQKYLTAALIDGVTLYVAADAVTARKAYEAASVLTGKKCALFTAKDEVLLYKDAISRDALFRRLTALSQIYGGAEFIACDVEAALQLIPDKLPEITLEKGKDYDYQSIPAELVKMGYTREYEVNTAGAFAIRGDVLDIFPVGAENPVRVDFFGDTVERIRPYDSVSGERGEETQSVKIVCATDAFVQDGDIPAIKKALSDGLKESKSEAAYRRRKAIKEEIEEKLLSSAPFIGAAYLMPLLSNYCSIFDVLPKSAVVVVDESKNVQDALTSLLKEHAERFKELSVGGEAFPFTAGQFISEERFTAGIKKFRTLAVQTFTTAVRFINPLAVFSLKSTPSPTYLNSVETFVRDVKNWLSNGYRVLAFSGGGNRGEKIKEALSDAYIGADILTDDLSALRGVTVCDEELSKGAIFHEAKLAVVGSGDLFVKAVTKRVRRKRGDMFVAPEIGDYAVHEKHGVGRITGTKKIETGDGIKEYVSVEYRGGDVLYVPVEQMDVLSKYMGDGNPTLSKIGGAEFERVKDRVRASIKKLAFDLKALYAERSERRGFAFPEHTAMMQEFEDSFDYEETPDQLASIEEIKSDMCSDKVMDRLLCGDVGYGKTEVALRAVYLCVLGGKQAAIMCPSTILSEQHYNTATERFKEFGLRIGKLNRFESPKQQAKTLKDLQNGDIDLVIGTHRLLSEDVKFYDLGLLVLDEEQRFGVEHKEKIKHIKNDIDCLTMTATPIPRTLHMSLAGIRDISTINTPPARRLPVQTYVVEETETLLRDAVIREISRGGQVFILYNRVETISSFTAKVCEIIPEAKVTYAHGRMDKAMLENNVFAFYRGEKNVLVTTTIIENGIDLPNANTIIVIDADRLGISQLYQLRGRVGRGTRLAQAYFTFKPDKVMTADAAERLKAIMQFTELGSGFKIAMRDLEIRGAGSVLGAEQHGHMDKVGYELYSKLLKEELTGESAVTAELDIKATAYIPESYIESSAGRMDAYKQIAEIRTVADYKRVFASIEENFGAMPDEVLNLLIIAVLKSYAAKYNVKKICVSPAEGRLELPNVNSLKDAGLNAALERYKGVLTLSMAKAPEIVFAPLSSQTRTMLQMTKFLKFASTFNQKG